MKLKDSLIILLITAALTVVGNLVGLGTSPLKSIPGVLILVLFSMLGILLSKVIPGKIPAVAYIVTIATIMTIPGVPFAEKVSELTANVDFLSLCTPILAYAGIYTGKDLDQLKKTGPKIIALALFVMLGTYLGSAIIAQVILKAIGQI